MSPLAEIAPSILERAIALVAPRLAMRRWAAHTMLQRAWGYEATSMSSRTGGWHTASTSGNAAVTWTLAKMRDRVRDLCRNDSWMKAGLEVVVNETVGIGIVPTIRGTNARKVARIQALWEAWAESPACDAEGLSDFYDLQALVMRTVAEGGSAIVRHRPRYSFDGLPVPMQLQVLESDHLDHSKDRINPNNARVIGGIEFDPIGRRTGYWLFRQHPGEMIVWQPYTSDLVPAAEVLHVFRRARAGQVNDVPWPFSAVIKARDLSEFGDAHLVKKKVSACIVGFVHDIEVPDQLPSTKDKKKPVEQWEPATLQFLPPGKDVSFPTLPSDSGYEDYEVTQQRAIAKAWGISFEALTGNFSRVNYSSARMAELRMRANVDAWRWRMLIPRFCAPAFAWFLRACEIAGEDVAGITATWTPPRRHLMDPAKEVPAMVSSVRGGLTTPSEMIRENGDDPVKHWTEYAEDIARLDELGITIESDARVPLAGGAVMEPDTGTNGDTSTEADKTK